MGNDSTGSGQWSTASATDITGEESFDRMLDREDRVLVDFYADWCGPCQMMAPTVEEFAAETEAAVVKVNVEDVPLVAHRYDVRSIPTFLGIADGDVVGRLEGMQDREDLERLVD